MGFKRTFLGRTDRGRRRQINEDAYFCSEKEGLCIVADGMGGHSFGEIASKMAVEALRDYINQKLVPVVHSLGDAAHHFPLLSQHIQTAIDQANQQIQSFVKTEDSKHPMGSTVVLLFFWQEYVLVAHVGDSRAYVFRQGNLYRLTEDHTVLNRWLKMGQISQQEAEKYRWSSRSRLVTKALGTRPNIRADIALHRVYHNDLFLLCTDGLTDLLEDEEIAEVLEEAEGHLGGGAKKLISMANARGGKDNITVILAHLATLSKKGDETEGFQRVGEGETEVFFRNSVGRPKT